MVGYLLLKVYKGNKRHSTILLFSRFAQNILFDVATGVGALW